MYDEDIKLDDSDPWTEKRSTDYKSQEEADHYDGIYYRKYALHQIEALAWECVQVLDETADYEFTSGARLDIFDQIELGD
jgi:hypothetical protein